MHVLGGMFHGSMVSLGKAPRGILEICMHIDFFFPAHPLEFKTANDDFAPFTGQCRRGRGTIDRDKPPIASQSALSYLQIYM
jgi:hypothetical protein